MGGIYALGDRNYPNEKGVSVECAAKPGLTRAERVECEAAYRAVCALPKGK
jgi:hypothetical protein